MSNSPYASNDPSRQRRSSSQLLTTVPGEENLTAEERHIYGQLFKAADVDSKGIVLGEEAVEFFKKSGVPPPILSEIWTAADDEQRGFLTQQEFYVALKLIACAQNGQLASEPVLTTTVPLPRFNDVYLEPYNSSASATPTPVVQVDSIKADERERFIRMFRSNCSPDGNMEATHAKRIFEKSSLPADTLNKIWNLANMRRGGSINQTEFVIAMFYISRIMDHTIENVPSSIPTSIYNSAAGRPGSPTLSRQPTISSPVLRNHTGPSPAAMFGQAAFADMFDDTWAIPQDQRTKFKSFFQQLDGQHTGSISVDEAFTFFRNSGLPQVELEQIWGLTGAQSGNRLDADEFTVAMHLIHERLNGKPIPFSLPQELVPPSHRTGRGSLSRQDTYSSAFHAASTAFPTASTAFARPNMPASPTSFQSTMSDNLFKDVDTLQSATNTMSSQKRTLESRLSTMKTQAQTNNIRLDQVRNLYESEARAVRKLEAEIASEQPNFDKAKSELEQAEYQLQQIKQQKDELDRRLQGGRDEAQRMKERVKTIYEECSQIRKQLEQLEKEGKQQGVRLNIGREQVNAAEKEKERLAHQLAGDDSSSYKSDIPNDGGSKFNPISPTFDASTSIAGSLSPASSIRSPTKKTFTQPSSDPFAEFTKTFQDKKQPPKQATLDSMTDFTSQFPDVDKFSAMGSPKNSLSPVKKDLTINTQKENNERRGTSVDISDIETKFPDLDTMDKDFPTPTESKSFSLERTAAADNAASKPATTSDNLPSLDDPFGTKSNVKPTGVFADAFSKPQQNTSKSTPNSKYGFDLSEFEVPSSSGQDGGNNTSSAAPDDFDTLFGNKPAKKKVNFDDAFGSWM